MDADFTNALLKILPDPGGEDVLKLRVGTVTSINTDGTADITLSGVAVPSVPVLSGAPILTGMTVQILSARGTLLIIGRTASTDARSVSAESLPNVSTSTASFAAAASNNVSGVFRFPASGRVRVDFSAEMYSTGGSAGQVMSIEIRTGDTVGSGSVVLAASDDYAVRSYDSSRQQFANFYAWTGGTTGAVYNVRALYKTTTGGITANFERRRLFVSPVLV